jgi:hypothetical protein
MTVLQDIPEEEWEKHGVQKLLEQTRAGLPKRDVRHGGSTMRFRMQP